MSKNYTLIFPREHEDMFEAVRSGEKKIETRAASFKYRNIKAGDTVTLSCDGDKFSKQVKKVTHFKTLQDMFMVFTASDINPAVHTVAEMVKIYESFPDYKEKIARFGILAIELE
jgi:ASC-1-like (ASCH) protein